VVKAALSAFLPHFPQTNRALSKEAGWFKSLGKQHHCSTREPSLAFVLI